MRPYIFPTIVMIAALALAAGAALFTILGFRELFEPSLKITFMAASIELGKIVAVSAIYQFRDILGWFSKSFMLFLIIVAMAVTSMGVYGYLSSSYQKDSLAITQNSAKLELLESRKATLEDRLAGMDTQIANVPEAYVSKRMELIATFKPERELVLAELDELGQSKMDLTLDKLSKETEFGAILLLANSVDWLDANKAMLYFILAVIFIFDPMAIALTFAANVGYANVATKKDEEENTVNIVDDSDWGNQLGKVLADINNNREQTDGALVSVSEALNSLANEVSDIKNSTPKNARSEIIDNMRKQNT
jgi:hypothetical protein